MKIKNLLMAFAFAGLAVSCSNDDNISGKPEATGPFDLKLKIAQVTTRSLDQNVAGGVVTPINTATLYLLKSTDNESLLPENLLVESTIELTQPEIDQLKKGHYIIQDIDDNIKSVALMINGIGTQAVPAGSGLSVVLEKRMDSQFPQIQPDEDNPGVSNSPLYGYSKKGFIVKDEGTGQNIREASVTVISQVARIQIFGEVKTEIEDLKITKIFLDNFIEDYNSKEKFEVGQVVGEVLDAKLSAYSHIFDMNPAGLATLSNKETDGVYAYHLYPQEFEENVIDKDRNVKLIIEMEYTSEGASVVQYSTLMLTKNEGTIDNPNYVGLEIDGGNIYTIDLGIVAWDGDDSENGYKPGDGGEKPNMGDNATVVVEVQPWTEVPTVPKG